MKIQWAKETWYTKVGSLIIMVVLPFLGFHFGVEYQKAAPEVYTSPLHILPRTQSENLPVAPNIPRTGYSESTHDGLTYTQAVRQYGRTRIQFNESCQVIPGSIVLPNDSDIMLDNRARVPHSIRLAGIGQYDLQGYDFRIVHLKSRSLPVTIKIDCGSGKNNGEIILN